MTIDNTPAVQSRLDPSRSAFIAVVGRKGTGKSILAHRLFTTYPYDRIVVDFHGDTLAPPPNPSYVEATPLADPPPLRFPPSPAEGEQATLRYVPDPGSPTYADDLDRVVGLAFFHRRTLLWIDEIGELTKANWTPPHLRRALHQGRHRQLSLLMCGPRPIHIDPLVVAQADYVYVFDLPNPRDRQRVADSIGWPPKDFDAAVAELTRPGPDGRPVEHRYLRYDARTAELVEFPPLPVRRHAGGGPPL